MFTFNRVTQGAIFFGLIQVVLERTAVCSIMLPTSGLYHPLSVWFEKMQAAAKLIKEYLQELCAQEDSILSKQNPAVSIGGDNTKRLVKGTDTSFSQSSDRAADFQLQRLPEVLGAYNTFITNLEHSAEIQEPDAPDEEGQAADDRDSPSVLAASIEMASEFRSELRRIIKSLV
jgi:hypothetical protein